MMVLDVKNKTVTACNALGITGSRVCQPLRPQHYQDLTGTGPSTRVKLAQLRQSYFAKARFGRVALNIQPLIVDKRPNGCNVGLKDDIFLVRSKRPPKQVRSNCLTPFFGGPDNDHGHFLPVVGTAGEQIGLKRFIFLLSAIF